MSNCHTLFEKIINVGNLMKSWQEFRVGKKGKPDIMLFERHLEDNIWQLAHDLQSKQYKHSVYQEFFINDPKHRHIHKASVRDRVLHHAIVRRLYPLFDPTFIHDSYSCRVGKGTHCGVERFVTFARKASKNYTKPCWVLKCDIKKFFASVDQNILLDLIGKRVHEEDVMWLINEVIGSFASDATIDTMCPKGLPLGNVTSQLFANVYMNELDQFVKHVLRQKYYIRYADDFAIMTSSKDACLQLIEPIKEFVTTQLKLELHPKKVTVHNFEHGVDFLGYICFPYHKIVRAKTKYRMFRKLRERAEIARHEEDLNEVIKPSLNSYLGLLSHANAYELAQAVLNKVFFWIHE